MKHPVFVAAVASVAVAALVSIAPAAHAQRVTPVSFGITAGASVPSGGLGDALDLGYHVGGLVNFRPVLSPISLRAELTYSSMRGRESAIGTGPRANDLSLLVGSLNAVYEFGAMNRLSTVKPYLIGGIGAYNGEFLRVSDNDGVLTAERSRGTKLGVNGGLGVRFDLAGFDAFTEARFHNIFLGRDGDLGASSQRFIPVSFGITF